MAEACDPLNACGRCERCRKRKQRGIDLTRPVRRRGQTPDERLAEAYRVYWEAETDEEFERARERVRKAKTALIDAELRARRTESRGTRKFSPGEGTTP